MPKERAQTLEDLFTALGPLKRTELERLKIDPKTVWRPSIVIGHKWTKKAHHPAADLLPDISGQAIFFPHSQLTELGLKVGRQVPTNKPYQFYRALTVLVRNALPDLPLVQAIVYMHHLPSGCENPTRIHGNHSALYRLLQSQGYVTVRGGGITSAWTNSGWHMLARVRENQRQAATINKIDASKNILEHKGITYEDAAKALGWTPAHAENYKALAREAGQPLNIFVIGTGWQKRLTFELEKVDTKSNATAEVAYWLLRTESGCTIDSVLDSFCRIAALVVHDKSKYTFDCSKFKRRKQDAFLETQGYIKINVGGREGGLQEVNIGLTPKGRALYRRLNSEGRLDETWHYQYI